MTHNYATYSDYCEAQDHREAKALWFVNEKDFVDGAIFTLDGLELAAELDIVALKRGIEGDIEIDEFDLKTVHVFSDKGVSFQLDTKDLKYNKEFVARLVDLVEKAAMKKLKELDYSAWVMSEDD